jgi:hypothetical protein
MLDLHTATDLIMSMIDELQKVFPESVHLKAQRAMVYYHMRGGCYRLVVLLTHQTSPRPRSSSTSCSG